LGVDRVALPLDDEICEARCHLRKLNQNPSPDEKVHI